MEKVYCKLYKLYGNTPSVKTIARVWGREAAVKIKALMDGNLDPRTFESVERWVRQCYNEPSRHEQRMLAINEVVDGYGVEVLGDVNSCDEKLIYAEYINTGDTYSATILFDRMAQRFHVTTWGDFVETLEKRGVKLP